MAESLGYKSGGGIKKFLIFLAVVALLAIVIVGIIMLVPKNTYSMTVALKENEQTFFLNDSEQEKQDFDSFTLKLTSGAHAYYADEINDIKTISKDMKKIMSVYSDAMFFVQGNKTFSKHEKSINNAISKTNDLQNQIDSLLEDTKNFALDASSFVKNAFIDFRNLFVELMENYQTMFTSLKACYEDCQSENFTNNQASSLVLQAYNDYIAELVKDYKELNKIDSKNKLGQADYVYSSQEKVVFFDKFVNSAFSGVSNYVIDPISRNYYQKVAKFFETYAENDFRALIGSIENGAGITKQYEVHDEEGILTAVKSFLDRR